MGSIDSGVFVSDAFDCAICFFRCTIYMFICALFISLYLFYFVVYVVFYSNVFRFKRAICYDVQFVTMCNVFVSADVQCVFLLMCILCVFDLLGKFSPWILHMEFDLLFVWNRKYVFSNFVCSSSVLNDLGFNFQVCFFIRASQNNKQVASQINKKVASQINKKSHISNQQSSHISN